MLNQIKPSLWKQVLRTNFVHMDKLADFLELDQEQRNYLLSKPRFALNVPYRLAAKIDKKTLEDPLLKQFLPTMSETLVNDGYTFDAVGDYACRKSDKLIQKYQGRVLLVSTSACAMHCRYCFRQHFDYAIGDKEFKDELKLIETDRSIHEVILSGGDPLSLDDNYLEALLQRLAAIPHVKKVRFHTRFPIGIPERIDDHFLNLLQRIPLQFWFVIHTNHARELDEDVLNAIKSIQKIGVPVLNQSVLLRGVNDRVEILEELFELLIDHGIMPYYLHQLDRAQGVGHFEVPEEEGLQLIAELRKRLPGYAVPQYVREVAGMPSKTPLTSVLQS